MQRKFIEYVRLQRRDGNRKYESLKNREREQIKIGIFFFMEYE